MNLKIVIIMIGFFILCLLIGCQERFTYQQWLDRYKPNTMAEAQAMAELQTKLKEADQKVKDAERMSKWKTIFVVGIVASVISIFLPIGIAWLKGVGAACAAGCFLGFEFLQANMFYPKIFGLIGAVFGGVIGLVSLYLLWRALKETILTVEKIKPKLSEKDSSDLFGNEGSIKKVIQSVTTSKIVNKIRNGKGAKDVE